MPATATTPRVHPIWQDTQNPAVGAVPGDLADRVLTEAVLIQSAARSAIHPERQRALGQYFTPSWVARLMASMVTLGSGRLRILDPGAGAGTLFTSLAAHCLGQDHPPRDLAVEAFEIDPRLRPHLERSADLIRRACAARSVPCEVRLRFEDFADSASREALGHLFSEPETFDAAIINPPYRKLASESELRARLDALGISAPNLYAAFLGLALRLVRPGGTVVAIVPRSFCNGTYFRRFRRYLLTTATIRRVHLFARRDQAFSTDSVLQENVILTLRPGAARRGFVSLSFSDGAEDDPVWSWRARVSDIVSSDDPDSFVHLPEGRWSVGVRRAMAALPRDLAALGLQVSTGPVVGFRMKAWTAEVGSSRATAPFLHPTNLRDLAVRWPVEGRKPQALARVAQTERALIPNGWYVATRRFTSKEEPRRVVASVIDPDRLPTDRIALDNHLNYFHRGGRPLGRDLALGLATFLNSTFVDRCFRQFSGHTQVNASDLRRLRYPKQRDLETLGASLESTLVEQCADLALRRHCQELHDMPETNHVQARIDEALGVLRDLGLPREQLNDRSALTLLALCGLRPSDAWSDALSPMMGVTPIMDWIDAHYGRTYAPNTRETFRRFTLHQFVDAGLVIPNPDQPDRPVNSPKFCYQIEAATIALLALVGSEDWETALAEHLAARESLRVRYAQRREMAKIPLVIKEGAAIALSPGGQNELVRQVVEEFLPRFAPAAEPVYVGDTAHKWAFLDQQLAESGANPCGQASERAQGGHSRVRRPQPLPRTHPRSLRPPRR